MDNLIEFDHSHEREREREKIKVRDIVEARRGTVRE